MQRQETVRAAGEGFEVARQQSRAIGGEDRSVRREPRQFLVERLLDLEHFRNRFDDQIGIRNRSPKIGGERDASRSFGCLAVSRTRHLFHVGFYKRFEPMPRLVECFVADLISGNVKATIGGLEGDLAAEDTGA